MTTTPTDSGREERAIEWTEFSSGTACRLAVYRQPGDYHATQATADDLIAALQDEQLCATVFEGLLDRLPMVGSEMKSRLLVRAEAAEAELERVRRVLCKQCLHPVTNHTDGCPKEESYWLRRMREEQGELPAEPAQSPPTPEKCWCHRCNPFDPKAISFSSQRMVVCPDCGNKRCPHAEDHDFECTRSNATGQVGVKSVKVDGDPPAPPAPTEAKLPGGFGPDYVTRAELVEALRGAEHAGLPYGDEALLWLGRELERGGRER